MKEVDKVVFESRSPEETEALGAQLAQELRAGDVIALDGDLGAGKTAFARGLARGLGYPGRVTSPTFTIVNEYEGGRLPLFHFDLYRLGSAEELFDIGWEDYLERGGVCCVEWSEVGGDCLQSARHIRISHTGQQSRRVELEEGTPCSS